MAKKVKLIEGPSRFVSWLKMQGFSSVFLLIFTGLFLYQTLHVQSLEEEIHSVELLKEQNSTVLQEWGRGKDYLTGFAQDLNEIRRFLLLPTKSYSFADVASVDLASEEQAEEEVSVLLFSFVEKLAAYEANQERYQSNLMAVKTALTGVDWSVWGLSVNTEGEYSEEEVEFIFRDPSLANVDYARLALDYVGNFSMDTYDGSYDLSDQGSAEEVVAELRGFFETELDDLRLRVERIQARRTVLVDSFQMSAVQELLKTKKLSVSAELASPEMYYFEIKNVDLVPVAQVRLSKMDGGFAFYLQRTLDGGGRDWMVDDERLMQEGLVEALNLVDGRSELEQRVLDLQNELKEALEDPAFQAILEDTDLHFGPMEESTNRISYPLLKSSGEVVRVIFIDKTTGEVRVERAGGEDSKTLSQAWGELMDSGKKKRWILV